MSASRKPLTVLSADDDDDDRGFIRKAWDQNRVANDLSFVEDAREYRSVK